MQSYVAGGTIQPGRFVIMSADNTVTQAAATTAKCIGVSTVASEKFGAATNTVEAANVGDPIRIFTVGDRALIEFSGTLPTAGAYVGPDANGRAVAVTAGQQAYGARSSFNKRAVTLENFIEIEVIDSVNV